MNDLGARLRKARDDAGVSLAAMAARTHYSKPLLGLLETGKRTIKPEHVAAYSRALNVSVATLYGRPDDPLRVAHEWLVADTLAHRHTAAGRRVGPSLASELERRVIELRHLDDVIGGGGLIPLVRRELTDAEHLVNESSYTEDTGRRLLTVVGDWPNSPGGRQRRRAVRGGATRVPVRCVGRAGRREPGTRRATPVQPELPNGQRR